MRKEWNWSQIEIDYENMNEFGMELKSKAEKEMNLKLNRIGNEKMDRLWKYEWIWNWIEFKVGIELKLK